MVPCYSLAALSTTARTALEASAVAARAATTWYVFNSHTMGPCLLALIAVYHSQLGMHHHVNQAHQRTTLITPSQTSDNKCVASCPEGTLGQDASGTVPAQCANW